MSDLNYKSERAGVKERAINEERQEALGQLEDWLETPMPSWDSRGWRCSWSSSPPA